MERKTRFELATLALARRCSTAELLPRGNSDFYALLLIFLAGKYRCTRRNSQYMSDGSLVFILLLLGGLFYLALMLWTTAVHVRESDANKPPPETHH
jgi:hypothetical protein